MKTTLRSAFLASLLLCSSLSAQTGVPQGISYQATITDETGSVIAPLPGAAIQYNITLRVFDSASDGALKWAEIFNGIPVSNGRFSVILGQGVPDPGAGITNPNDLATIFDEQDRFVEISVVPTAGGTTKTFKPRQQLLASPTAMRAKVAEVALEAEVALVAQGLAPGTLAANAITNGTLTGDIFNDGAVRARKLGAGVVDDTEFNRLDGVTSPIQTQLNAKAPLSNPNFTGSIGVDSGNTNNGTFSPGIRFGATNSKEGISSRRTAGGAQTNGLSFYTANSERMTITNKGAVLINSIQYTSPGDRASLEVGQSTSGLNMSSFHKYERLQSVFESGVIGPVKLAMYAYGTIAANAFYAKSDMRIKSVSGPSKSDKDLAILNEIEITDYTFIDKFAKGPRREKKVIAQQVEKVFPQAVTKITDFVPDIFKNATVKDGWVTLVTDLKKGEKVRLISPKTEGIYEILEVKEGQFRTSIVSDQKEIFVYGREVDDFRMVDYEAISMLNVSATQELHRRLEAKTKEIEEMKKEMAALKGLVSNLQSKDETRENRLIAIEKMLTENREPVKTVSK